MLRFPSINLMSDKKFEDKETTQRAQFVSHSQSNLKYHRHAGTHSAGDVCFRYTKGTQFQKLSVHYAETRWALFSGATTSNCHLKEETKLPKKSEITTSCLTTAAPWLEGSCSFHTSWKDWSDTSLACSF